jgi:hypothetical protein
MSFGLGQQQSSSPPTNSQSTDPIDSSTPWVAAADGNLPLLQRSLQILNLDFHRADENGYTLLMAAASYSQLPVLQWLLQQAAQNSSTAVVTNAVDNDGDSALHHASSAEAAKMLIQHGIDTSIRNAAGLTALESKQNELEELMENEDMEDDDADTVSLRGVIEYLSSLPQN